jgi:acyl carrier protein
MKDSTFQVYPYYHQALIHIATEIKYLPANGFNNMIKVVFFALYRFFLLDRHIRNRIAGMNCGSFGIGMKLDVQLLSEYEKDFTFFKMRREQSVEYEEFAVMVCDAFGLNRSEVNEDTSFLNDLGIDSLSLANFIIKLEHRYRIKINLSNVWDLKNMREAYGKFSRALAAADFQRNGNEK